jgi:hypothetical protein
MEEESPTRHDVEALAAVEEQSCAGDNRSLRMSPQRLAGAFSGIVWTVLTGIGPDKSKTRCRSVDRDVITRFATPFGCFNVQGPSVAF